MIRDITLPNQENFILFSFHYYSYTDQYLTFNRIFFRYHALNLKSGGKTLNKDNKHDFQWLKDEVEGPDWESTPIPA
jgi:hypothetical protein